MDFFIIIGMEEYIRIRGGVCAVLGGFLCLLLILGVTFAFIAFFFGLFWFGVFDVFFSFLCVLGFVMI